MSAAPASTPPDERNASSPSSFSDVYDPVAHRKDRPGSTKRPADDGAGSSAPTKKLKQETDHETLEVGSHPSTDVAAWTLSGNKISELLHGETCQSCNVSNPPGLRVAWQLGVRLCASCLIQMTQSENDLMFSDYSMLLSVAPFAFISGVSQLMSSAEVKQHNGLSGSIRKVYLTSNLKMLKERFDKAREISGPDAARLFAEMKEAREEDRAKAEKWEEWEARRDQDARLNAAKSPVSEVESSTTTALLSTQSPVDEVPFTESTIHAPAPVRQIHNKTLASPVALYTGQSQPRTELSAEELESIKSSRKFDIYRRCAALEPPISPGLLEHMESFHASLQIPQALTEKTWDVLKSRLLKDKGSAKKKQKGADHPSTESQSSKTPMSASRQNLRDLPDNRTQEQQDLLRHQLGLYADELIYVNWENGKSVNYMNAPKFAAQLLTQIRERYFEELKLAPSEAFEKLTLGDMKWVYDNRIKQHAESRRKQLFLCNRCADKFRGFDSVNQHFAAKHPNEFGVQWQTAEWHSDPPFAPDPDLRARSDFKDPTNPVYDQNRRHNTAIPPPPPPPPVAGAWMTPHHYGPSTPVQGPFGGYNFSPHPYSQTPYMMGQFAPPPPTAPYQVPLQTGHGSPATSTNQPSYVGHPQYHPYLLSSSPARSPYPSAMWPPPPGPFNPSVPFQPSINQVNSGPLVEPVQGQHATNVDPRLGPTLFQAHMELVSDSTNHVWSFIGKDANIPESVKAYTIIYHVAHDFRERTRMDLNIDLFMNVLSLRQSLLSLREIPSLACKTCVSQNESSSRTHSSPHVDFPSAARRLYSFESLLCHFRNVHLDGAKLVAMSDSHRLGSRYDFKTDLIELPSDRLIEALRDRLEGFKLQLIARAFPHIFQMHISTTAEARELAEVEAGSDPKMAPSSRRMSTQVHEFSYVKQRPKSRTREHDSPASTSPPAAAEDEYDPRRPIFEGVAHPQSWPTGSRVERQDHAREDERSYRASESRDVGDPYDSSARQREPRDKRRRYPSHAREFDKWKQPPSHKMQPLPRSGDKSVIVKGDLHPPGLDRSAHSIEPGGAEYDFVQGNQPSYNESGDSWRQPAREWPESQQVHTQEEVLFLSRKDGHYYRRRDDGMLERVNYSP